MVFFSGLVFFFILINIAYNTNFFYISLVKVIEKVPILKIDHINKLFNEFDLVRVFKKKQLSNDEVISLTKKDGLIIIDNVLWHGEVADKNNKDSITSSIRDFNNYVKNDKKTEQVIIPIGDGLTVCRKL